MRLIARLAFACVLGLAACGPAPTSSAAAASGTLVVVIRQGPERVPFDPKAARIQRANDQLARILGHSLEIELDGALLPQTRDGADDVIARLVEEVARDVDGLSWDPKALAFARANFDRLTVRYAPAEAAAREDRRRRSEARFEPSSKTVDIASAEARWLAVERGEIATVLHRAYAEGNAARYANVLPDALPPQEARAWFDYHAHATRTQARPEDPYARIGSIEALRVRGMVMLAARVNDAELTKDVRAWLVRAMDDFSSTYHHHAAEVEGAPPGSSYRQAESAYIGWLRSELPRMSIDERGKIVTHLFVTDFRKDMSERDRFASYAFPGIDPAAVSFDAIDAWIAAGHPPAGKEYFDHVVCPATIETDGGRHRYSHAARCDGDFYRWSFAKNEREDALVKGVLARGDVPLATATFYNARRTLRDESDYLRFLRRFESAAPLWKIGADVHGETVFRPSSGLLEESRRWWRELPPARGEALFWFARHIDGSYDPEADWPDLVQGKPGDEAVLAAYLDIGWDAFELLPVAWRALAKSGGRMRLVTSHARELLGTNLSIRPGGRGVAGTLAALAGVLCAEGSKGELAELRAFGEAELAARPGAGLSDVVEATDPAKCAPAKPRVTPHAGSSKRPKPPRRADPNLPPDWKDR